MKKILLLTLLFTSAYLFAQPRQGQYSGGPGGGQGMPTDGKIKGLIVTGQDNKPLEYASIGVYRTADSSLVTGTLSDAKGMFTIENLPFGKFYLEVNYVGFKKSRVNNILITPKSKEANIGNINVIENTTKINEVEVVGSRNQVEYKLDKKVVNVSSNLTASGGTAVDALQNVPSVQTDVDGNVLLRGSGNYQVLIDGKPSVLQGTEALQQIPAGTIENIEIITNPSAKYDADGVAGIINVVMKKQKFSGISGIINGSVASVPQYSTDFLLSYRTNKLNVFLGADWMNQQNPGNMKITQETFHPNDTNTFQHTDANNIFTRKGYGVKGGVEWKVTDNNSLSFNVAYGNRDFDRTSSAQYHKYTLPATSNDSTYLQYSSGMGSRTYYNLNTDYRHTFEGAGHELTASVYYANGANDNINDNWNQLTDQFYRNPDSAFYIKRTASNAVQGDLRTKADYVKPFNEKSKLELGYQGRYNTTLDTFYTQLGYNQGDNLGAKFGNPYDRETIHFVDNVQAIYGTYSNTLGFIDFQAGLRAEYNYRSLESAISATTYKIDRLDFFPTLHLSKQLANEQQIQLSYSRRVQRPDERQLDPYKQWFGSGLTYMIGNPKLNPQFTDSYELNFQKKFATGFWSIEAYYRQTNGLMERAAFRENGDTMRMTSINVGKDGSLGLEAMINWDITKWWNLNVTATGYYYQIKGSLPQFIDTIPAQSLNSNTYTGNIRLNAVFKLPGDIRLQLTAMYNAPNIEPQQTEGHMFMTGFALRKDFYKRKLSATLQMRDVFNTMKRTGTSFGPGFISNNEFHRNGQILVLTLSYKFNNFKQERKGDDTQQRDFGGEEMQQ